MQTRLLNQCAQSLGAPPRAIDVFGLARGEGNSFSFYSEGVPLEHQAVINVAGKTAERLLNCTFEAEQHPLAWQMIHKSRIPNPGELAYPPIMIGDGAHFIINMLKIGTPNPMKFLDES